METRARYALIGLFMLAVIAASFAFVYWLENKGGFAQRETYQVKFQGSVSGLSDRLGRPVQRHTRRRSHRPWARCRRASESGRHDRGRSRHADPRRYRGQHRDAGPDRRRRRGAARRHFDGAACCGRRRRTATLLATPQAGQDWTQAARDAFQRVDKVLAENSEALKSAITNIDTFAGALARNSDRVDGILAGIERMTGGGTSPADTPVYDLAAATDLPPPPAEAPSWLLVVPEPTTLMGFNTDKILLQPSEGESVPVANARWGDNVPILVQAKVIQSFENAGYAKSVSRTRDGVAGDYQLLLDIRRFQISTASEPATAEIDFIAKLVDKDGKIVNASTFQGNAPANGTDAQAYVKALDEVFAKLAGELVGWVTTALAEVPPPPPPARASD